MAQTDHPSTPAPPPPDGLPGELALEFEDARRQQRLAEDAQRNAATASRKLVQHVLAAGLSKRDTARVLGLSPQRISQLTTDPSYNRRRPTP